MSTIRDIVGAVVVRCYPVHDYVQLELDRVGLSLYNPILGLEPTTEQLLGFTGRVVTAVEAEDDQWFRIRFDGGPDLVISLRPQDYTGPEAIVIHFATGEIMVIQ